MTRRAEPIIVNPPPTARAAFGRLAKALDELAKAGLRPHCSDPETKHFWLSEKWKERRQAVEMCDGCDVITECREAGEASDERFLVFGGHDFGARERAR